MENSAPIDIHSSAVDEVSQLIHSQDPDYEPESQSSGEADGATDAERDDERDVTGDSEIDEIARLLSGEGLEDAAAEQPEGTAGEDEPEPAADTADPEGIEGVTLKELAERLEVDPADIYDELQIPLGDDEYATLGEWKDRVKALKDVDGERDTVTQARADHEKQVLQLRTEFNEIMSMLPADQRMAVAQQAGQRTEQYKQEQEAAALEAIPGWKDLDSRAKDRALLVEVGSEYGFSEQEITYTHDARTLRWMHDNLRLRERNAELDKQLKAIKSGVGDKRVPNKPGRPGRGKSNPTKQQRLSMAVRKAKTSGSEQAKEAVVSELLRSQ